MNASTMPTGGRDARSDDALRRAKQPATAILGVSGWLGGKLAYTYGVRVADEERQREGFRVER